MKGLESGCRDLRMGLDLNEPDLWTSVFLVKVEENHNATVSEALGNSINICLLSQIFLLSPRMALMILFAPCPLLLQVLYSLGKWHYSYDSLKPCSPSRSATQQDTDSLMYLPFSAALVHSPTAHIDCEIHSTAVGNHWQLMAYGCYFFQSSFSWVDYLYV